jgi:hypothetical protein
MKAYRYSRFIVGFCSILALGVGCGPCPVGEQRPCRRQHHGSCGRPPDADHRLCGYAGRRGFRDHRQWGDLGRDQRRTDRSGCGSHRGRSCYNEQCLRRYPRRRIFASSNGGLSWSPANNGLTTLIVTAIAINPNATSTIYAGTDGGGVFKTTDSGVTWAPANTGLTNTSVQTLAIDPIAPSATVWAGTDGGGVFQTTNAGVGWSQENAGLTNLDVEAIVINPNLTATVYVGTDGGGVYKSTNVLPNWSPENTGLTNTTVLALEIDPSDPDRIYAGTPGGFFRERGRRTELAGQKLRHQQPRCPRHRRGPLGSGKCICRDIRRRHVPNHQCGGGLGRHQQRPCQRNGKRRCRRSCHDIHTLCRHAGRRSVQEYRWGNDLDGGKRRVDPISTFVRCWWMPPRRPRYTQEPTAVGYSSAATGLTIGRFPV